VNVYIWERIEKCSSNHHGEGGVVVFANSENRAREIANAEPGCSIQATELPDHVMEIVNADDELVVLFPDAGCC